MAKRPHGAENCKLNHPRGLQTVSVRASPSYASSYAMLSPRKAIHAAMQRHFSMSNTQTIPSVYETHPAYLLHPPRPPRRAVSALHSRRPLCQGDGNGHAALFQPLYLQ